MCVRRTAAVTFTPEREIRHSSRPRNKIIVQAFFDMHVIEKYGSGWTRIKRHCDKNGNQYPTFEDGYGQFAVKYLPRKGEMDGVINDTINGAINGGIKSLENRAENAIGGLNGGINGGINGAIKLQGCDLRVYEAIVSEIGIGRDKLSAILDLGTTTIDRSIKYLKDNQLIAHRGSKKTGGYFPYDAAIDGKEQAQ